MNKSRMLMAAVFVLTTVIVTGCGDDQHQNTDESGVNQDTVTTDTTGLDAAIAGDTTNDSKATDLASPETIPADFMAGDESAPDDAGTDPDAVTDAVTDQGQSLDSQADTGPAPVPEVGDMVPDFMITAHDNTTFKLSDHRGKYVVISAFPMANTSVCTWQNDYIRDNIDSFTALNTTPVGLSTDSVATLAGWVTTKGYPHLLLSDTSPFGALSKQLGIFSILNNCTQRALLVVDPTGRLIYKQPYAMSSKPDFAAMLTFIENHVTAE